MQRHDIRNRTTKIKLLPDSYNTKEGIKELHDYVVEWFNSTEDREDLARFAIKADYREQRKFNRKRSTQGEETKSAQGEETKSAQGEETKSAQGEKTRSAQGEAYVSLDFYNPKKLDKNEGEKELLTIGKLRYSKDVQLLKDLQNSIKEGAEEKGAEKPSVKVLNGDEDFNKFITQKKQEAEKKMEKRLEDWLTEDIRKSKLIKNQKDAEAEAEAKRKKEEAEKNTFLARIYTNVSTVLSNYTESGKEKQREEAGKEAEAKRKKEEAAKEAETKRKKEEVAKEAEAKRKKEEAVKEAESKRKKEEAENAFSASIYRNVSTVFDKYTESKKEKKKKLRAEQHEKTNDASFDL